MIKENLVFIREFLTEFQTTGACFPTSRWAAEAMTIPLREKGREPRKILELGPGTGSVTVRILADMIPGDTLTICEINPRFMRALKIKLSSNPDFIRHQDNVKFFEGSVQAMPEDVHYDSIVCALPFLNFDLETVKEIFAKLRRVSRVDTLMTYYEYIGLRKLGKAVAPESRRRRLQEIDGFLKDHADRSRLGRERVWLNVLPINIYTVRPAA